MSTSTQTANGVTTPSSRINWGGVMKGVAIISLAVVAVAAVYVGLGGVVEPLLSGMTGPAGAFLEGAVATGASMWQQALSFWTPLWSQLGTAVAGIPEALGYTTTLTKGTAASVATAVQAAGTGVAAAVVIPATAQSLQNIPFTTPSTPAPMDTASSGILASMKSTMASSAPLSAHAMHDISHASHHAGEHSSSHGQKLSPGEQPRAGWRDMFSARQPSAQPLVPGEQPRGWSHKFTPAQNAASMASSTPRSHQPRDPNFSIQLDADREALRKALGDGGIA